jgi:Zn-dependent protease with chaperone function
MGSFILDFIVNVIILAVVIPVTQYIFHYSLSGVDPLLEFFHLPVSETSALWFVSIAIVLIVSLVTAILIYVWPGFEKSICLMNTGRSPRWDEKQYLEGIMADIEAAAGKPLGIDVYVSNYPQPNAAAMGRHSIVVMRSLMQYLDRNELRGVLAHEVGHLAHRDTIWGLLRYSVSTTGQIAINFLVIISYAGSLLAFIPVVGLVFVWIVFVINLLIAALQYLLRLPAQILSLCGSRRVEYEADAFAVSLGYGSDLYSALLKISRLEPERNLTQRVLSTHPLTRDRLKRIQKEIYEQAK